MNSAITDIISESSMHEFKSELNLSKPKNWLKTVSAFSNSPLGGVILIGVDNNGNITGVDNVQKISEKFSETVLAKIDPMPNYHLEPKSINDKIILIIHVFPGQNTPYYYVESGTRIAYVRMGEESIPATSHALNNLILKGMNKSFDSLVTTEKKENHTFLHLKKTLLSRAQKNLTDEMLVSYGLVTQDGFLTNAGILLSDQCNLLQSRVFATRWNGIDKTTSKDEAFDSKEFNGNILYLLEESEKFVNLHNRKAWHKETNYRVDKEAFNTDAIHEILVNALIHRDYSIIGSEVHIDMFDDRLEVYNPGGMFNGILLEKSDPYHIESSRRNPIIADVFDKCNLMEREGSGLKKIMNLYKDNPPIFHTANNSFVITLRSELIVHDVDIPNISKFDLSVSEQRVINYLLSNHIESFKVTDLLEPLNLKKTQAYNLINKLLNKGLISKVKNGKYCLDIYEENHHN